MANTLKEIWREALETLRKSIGQIFTTHLAYIALGFILFTPLIGMLGHLLLKLSGKSALSDLDIAWFLLSPVGMLALIVMAALLIAILAFEQASMMAISAGAVRGMHIGTLQALHFTARRAARIFRFTIHLVARLLIITLPFLAAAGAIAWLLLTDYDINYYLSEKPPVFLLAAAVIVMLLLAMLVVLVRKLSGWSLALPLVLFTDTPPASAFAGSNNLVEGHKRRVVTALLGWAAAALLLGAIIMAGVQLLGSLLAPLFFDSIKMLVMVLGGVVALWSLANLAATTLTSGSFAALVVILFERYGAITTSDLTDKQSRQLWRMTAPRLALLLIVAVTAAAVAGSWLMNGIQTQDNVLVIAHRGAAGKAPENTLASIRQAIEDGADMIEIDVQESSDGEIVVIHDSDFMKLSGIDLKVWDGSLKQIQEIDIGSWFDPGFSAERVPTLAQVLEMARGKVRVIIELKYYGHDQQLEQRVVDSVEKAGMVDDIVIMSLQYKGIEKIRALRPEWGIGLLSTKAVGNLANLDLDFLAVNMSMATSGFIRRTHAAGKHVYVWTVNDAVSISRMISLGVDGIITDEPEIARKVVTERSGLSSVERLLIHTAVLFGRPIPPRIYRDESP